MPLCGQVQCGSYLGDQCRVEVCRCKGCQSAVVTCGGVFGVADLVGNCCKHCDYML